MPDLDAYRESLTHRHTWTPLGRDHQEPALDRCTCGAVRRRPFNPEHEGD